MPRIKAALLFGLALFAASPAYAVMEDYPSIKLQGLDKSVGRTVTFEAKVGSTIQYGPLFIKIQSCRKAPPIEQPESAAFLQIWEVPPGAEKSEWVYSGWMFSSSPALSAMDHPVYDVWILDCLGKEQPNAEAAKAQTTEEADQTNLTPADGETPAADTPPAVEDSEAEPDNSAPTVSPALPVPQEVAPNPYLSPEPEQGAESLDDRGVTAYDYMNGRVPAPSTAMPQAQEIPAIVPDTDEPAQVEEEAPEY